jgi:hypothetical protein
MKKILLFITSFVAFSQLYSQAPTFTLPTTTCENYIINLAANNGTASITGYTWSSSPFAFTFSSPNSAITSASNFVSGIYTVQLIVTDGFTNTTIFSSLNVLANNGFNITMPVSGPNGPICPPPTNIGQVPLITSGGASYTWQPGNVNSATINIHPPINTTYTMTGTYANGCINNGTHFVQVHPLPIVNVSGPNNVCAGNPACFNATGNLSIYSWNGPCGYSAFGQNVCPIINSGCGGTFTVGGVGANSCINETTITTLISPSPTINVSSGSTLVCQGQTTTLTLTGALNTQTWSTGSQAASIVIAPTTNTMFTVNGKNTSLCNFSQNVSLSVTPSPTVIISNATPTVCAGASAILIASGANTYSWNGGAVTNSIIISPTVNTTYSVTGTSAANCKNAVAYTQIVIAYPTLILTNLTPTICIFNSATITASGAASYSWNTGATTNSIVVTPTISSTYSVIGSNAFTCTSSSSFFQTVYLCNVDIDEEFLGRNEFKIYPNPANDFLTVEAVNILGVTLEILNCFGQSMKKEFLRNDSYKINLGDLAEGVYFVRLFSVDVQINEKSKILSRRFVISR